MDVFLTGKKTLMYAWIGPPHNPKTLFFFFFFYNTIQFWLYKKQDITCYLWASKQLVGRCPLSDLFKAVSQFLFFLSHCTFCPWKKRVVLRTDLTNGFSTFTLVHNPWFSNWSHICFQVASNGLQESPICSVTSLQIALPPSCSDTLWNSGELGLPPPDAVVTAIELEHSHRRYYAVLENDHVGWLYRIEWLLDWYRVQDVKKGHSNSDKLGFLFIYTVHSHL